jgi:hypothetical protein
MTCGFVSRFAFILIHLLFRVVDAQVTCLYRANGWLAFTSHARPLATLGQRMSTHGRSAPDTAPDVDVHASVPSSDPSCEGGSLEHPSDLVGLDSPTGAPITSLKLLLTNSQASALIGKRGAQIRTIQSSSGARVKIANTGDCFPGTNDRAVLISGSRECVAAALDLILNRLYTVCDGLPADVTRYLLFLAVFLRFRGFPWPRIRQFP